MLDFQRMSSYIAIAAININIIVIYILAMPHGWEESSTPDGRKFYIK